MHPLITPIRRIVVLICVLAAAAAPAHATENDAHPLTLQIWDTRANQAISLSTLGERLQNAHFVLLGEVHDNSNHHRLRRDLIAGLISAGRRPAIAMEQFDREHQPAIDRSIAAAPRDAERLRSAGSFNDQGWDWPDYVPIIQLALDSALPLLAANLSREQAFSIATSSAVAILGEQSTKALGLDKPLPATAQQKLERAIDEGHCGKAPAKILPGMLAAQRARDAVMAQIVMQQRERGVVLIAGNGHVRRDFGVPLYLPAGSIPGAVISAGFIEVQDGMQKPADYYDTADPEYDYIVFTERAVRDDPCATLKFKPRQPVTQP